jgi:hypothetical protein
MSALTLVEAKDDRLSDTTLPEVLNADSEATDVAGIARNCRAIIASFGNFVSFNFHQFKMSKVTSHGSFK